MGIRFKLSPKTQSKEFREKYKFGNQEQELFKAVDSSQEGEQSIEKKLDNERKSLSELSDLLLSFHSDIKSLLYSYPKNSDPIFKKGLSVNKTWLKHWHKQTFYNQIKKDNNKNGKYAFSDLKVLHQDFLSWLNIWKEHSSELEKASKEPKYSQFRHSDIAWNVRSLLNRSQWDYMNEFLNEIHTVDGWVGEEIKKLKNSLQKIHNMLKAAEEYYLPSQSSGIEITKASFNYYTVDKKKKEYYEDKLQKTENKVYNNPFSKIERNLEGYKWMVCQSWFLNESDKIPFQFNDEEKREIFNFKSDQEQEWIKRYFNKGKFKGDLDQGFSLSLDQTYSAIKSFKSEQKDIFYKLVSHIAREEKGSCEFKHDKFVLSHYVFSYKKFNKDGVSKEFSLFKFEDKKHIKSEDQYNKFIKISANIENEKLPQDRKKNAKKRGEFLFRKNCYFTKYGNFCETYKKIAQQRGRLIAQNKGVEKEKQESRQTGFLELDLL